MASTRYDREGERRVIGLRWPGASGGTDGGVTDLWIEDEEFEERVRSGQIGPDTLVWAGPMTGGRWRRAEDLEIFHLFRAEPVPPGPPPFSLRDRLFPPRGFSGTELLLLANIAVAAMLLGAWRESYSSELVQTMSLWRRRVGAGEFWWVAPTIFLHADAGHLLRNLAALLVTSAGAEIFFGRWRTWLIYLVAGWAGAAVSYFGHSGPPLSVGASGAIFGLAGVMVSFLVRSYRRLGDRQKWKTRRVYLPLLLFLIPPSLFQADWQAHSGGFAAGVLLGFLVPISHGGEALLAPPPGHRKMEDELENAPSTEREP